MGIVVEEVESVWRSEGECVIVRVEEKECVCVWCGVERDCGECESLGRISGAFTRIPRWAAQF